MRKTYATNKLLKISYYLIIIPIIILLNQSALGQDNERLIRNFPYLESFEYIYGKWCQSEMDDFDWSLNVGLTSTDQTGPMSAYEGNCYIYTRAAENPSSRAELISPAFRLDNLRFPVLSFAYNMYGTDIGSLEILSSIDGGKTFDERVFSIQGNKGNSWYVASIDLRRFKGSDVSFKIIGITRNGDKGDMALDYVYVGEKDGFQLQDKELMRESAYEIKVKTLSQDNHLIVELPEEFIATSSLEVINLLGRKAYSEEMCNSNYISIDISGFDNGLYFLRVYHQGETYTHKIYVNK